MNVFIIVMLSFLALLCVYRADVHRALYSVRDNGQDFLVLNGGGLRPPEEGDNAQEQDGRAVITVWRSLYKRNRRKSLRVFKNGLAVEFTSGLTKWVCLAKTYSEVVKGGGANRTMSLYGAIGYKAHGTKHNTGKLIGK